MLFNSYVFIFIFLPISLLGYFAFNHWGKIQWGKAWLVGASLYFYSFYNIKNLPLILLSLSVNYLLGLYLVREETKISKKLLLQSGLVFNLLLLCFFKYADSAVLGLNWLFNSEFSLFKLALPLGLSFYTLQQISYIVDAYQGMTQRKSLLDYAFFVTFFPQLISGPIVNYRSMMPQIEDQKNKHFDLNNFSLGIFIFCIGLAKKVLISEEFATWAKPGFDELTELDLLAAWKTSLSYTFQLYYDFSGYTDMAIGVGRMFNIKLPPNFNSPFRSKNVIEFWSRWHMSLTQFINSYVFTPIVRAMPEINFRNTMFATFIAMFLAGVWHGAGWNFAVYGAVHGAALVVNHIRKKKKKKLPAWLAIFLTFNFVNLALVIFRASSLATVAKIYKGMLGLSGVVVPKIGIKSVGFLKDYGFKMGTYLYPNDYLYLVLTLAVIMIIRKAKNTSELEKDFKPTTSLAFVSGVVFVFCLFGLNRISEFIYFNF